MTPSRILRTGALFALAISLSAAERPSETDRLIGLISESQYEAALEAMRRVPDLNAQGSEGWTPLTTAARATSNDAYDMVHALLLMGANPNRANRDGMTALHYAAMAGTLSVVHILVDRFGAKPGSPRLDNDGKPDKEKTPIVLAARWGHPRIVRFLESRGSKFPENLEFKLRFNLASNTHYERLLGDPAKIRDVPFARFRALAKARLEALREVGAPPRVIERQQEHVRIMEELAVKPEWQDRSNSDLSEAADKGSFEIVRKLPGFYEQSLAWGDRLRGDSQ